MKMIEIRWVRPEPEPFIYEGNKVMKSRKCRGMTVNYPQKNIVI